MRDDTINGTYISLNTEVPAPSDWQSPFEDNIPFDFALNSPDPRMAAAVEYLMALPELRIGRKAAHHLTLIVANLAACSKLGSEKRASYNRGNDYYSSHIMQAKHFNPQGIGRGIVKSIDALIKLDFVNQAKGRHGQFGERPLLARMWPTDKFINGVIKRFELHLVTFDYNRGRREVIVQDKQKNHIHLFNKDPAYIEMVSKIKKYNDIYRGIGITVQDAMYEVVAPDIKFIYRTFKSSMDKLGRFYGGWWLTKSKEDRKTIRINGEATVELDYRGQHIGLLYGMTGEPMPETLRTDPYAVFSPEFMQAHPSHRADIKICVLCAINSTTPAQAWGGVNSERHKDKLPDMSREHFDRLMAEFCTNHPTIAPLFYQEHSLTLQYLDSTVADAVLDRLMLQQGIPVLPVHDSFIVREQDKEKLLEAMIAAYTEADNPAVKNGYTSIKDSKDDRVYLFRT